LKSFPNFQTIPSQPLQIGKDGANYAVVIQQLIDSVQELNSLASGLQLKCGKEGKQE